MTALSTDDDVASCHEQVAGYLLAIDRGRATEAIDAFTADAVVEIGGRELRGRAEVLGFLRHREARSDRLTCHAVSNAHVAARGDDEIVLGAVILLFLRSSAGRYELDTVLDSTHTLRRTPAGWRISARTVRPLHAVPGTAA